MGKVSTSYKPGQSGNLKGRPKDAWTWSGLIREAMEKNNLDGEPFRLAVANALLDKAANGDVLAIKEIGNRIDGMPKQSVDTKIDGTLEVIIRGYEDNNNSSEEAEGSDQSE